MSISISFSDIIAALALLISAYVAWQQRGLGASQKCLNELYLKQGEASDLDASKANLGASFINIGKHSYRLKIWNQGKASAQNVRIEILDGNRVFLESDIKSKFPLEILEPHGSVELLAAISIGSKNKYHIKLIWDDKAGKNQEKSLYPTI